MKFMHLKVKERSLNLDNDYVAIKVSSWKERETKIMGEKREEKSGKREERGKEQKRRECN